MGVVNSEVLDTLNADPVDLESCFSNHYIVPDYQRDYVWTEKEVGQLLVDLKEAYQMEISHRGDTKQVMRTELMRRVAPQVGFKGEKDYNPFYMLIRVLDQYPILIANENFCWVEYQIGADSMSQGIWKQYKRSPRSWAKYRINQMTLKHGNPLKNRFRLCVHYIASCILSADKDWLRNSPFKGLTILAIPFGLFLT